MLKLSLSALNAIERGVKPRLKVTVYFQQPEIYTEDDLLLSVGPRNTSMSSEGAYEIANTTIQLKDENGYFSMKFAKELPVRRLVEIYMEIGDEEILDFAGIVSAASGGWNLKGGVLTLSVNA